MWEFYAFKDPQYEGETKMKVDHQYVMVSFLYKEFFFFVCADLNIDEYHLDCVVCIAIHSWDSNFHYFASAYYQSRFTEIQFWHIIKYNQWAQKRMQNSVYEWVWFEIEHKRLIRSEFTSLLLL